MFQTPTFSPARAQQGISVVIALLVLSAIMLAATALIRSADSAGLIARNYAFQRNSIDVIEAALQIARRAGNTAAVFDAGNVGNVAPFYFSTRQALDARGIPAVLNAVAPATGTFTGGNALPGGATGFFVIERLCEFPVAAELAINNCEAYFTGNKSLSTYTRNGDAWSGSVLYRITVRVDAGPGNWVYGQSIITNDAENAF